MSTDHYGRPLVQTYRFEVKILKKAKRFFKIIFQIFFHYYITYYIYYITLIINSIVYVKPCNTVKIIMEFGIHLHTLDIFLEEKYIARY